MKLNRPIEINLKDFFLEGKFDYIKPGKTKEWILNNFPDPDDDSDMGHKLSIWRYIPIEFHFDGEELFTIWCDYLIDIEDNEKLVFDKWILEKPQEELTLPYVLSVLNTEKCNYLVKFNNYGSVIVRIKKSGVCLWFNNPEDEEIDTNKYLLFAFGLSSEEYDSFETGF